MTPREAEKLLGGYAAGNLTEEERQALFQVALEDQSLFDALVDEESFRELLADPAARVRILAALTAPPSVPLWRRPSIMGLAASVLVAVGVGLFLKQGQEAPQPRALPELSPSTPRLEKRREPEAAEPQEKARSTPQRRRESPKAETSEAASPAPVPPPPLPQPTTSFAASPPGQASTAAAGATMQVVPRPADSSAAYLAPGVAGDAWKARESKVQADTSPKQEMVGVVASVAVAEPPVPQWVLSPEEKGHRVLMVLWRPTEFLYLLRRSSVGVVILQPDTTKTYSDGRRESRYSLVLHEGEAFDLYLLSEPVQAPSTLPESGPIPGSRIRIWPPEKKQP